MNDPTTQLDPEGPAGEKTHLNLGGVSWSVEQTETLFKRFGELGSTERSLLFRTVRREAKARGEAVRVEDILKKFPSLADNDEWVLDLVYGEVLEREALGENPGPEEYEQRFPAHAARIQRQFEFHRAMGQVEKPDHEDLPQIPGYNLVETLGRGGMGVVYKAWQRDLKRHVAVKMLLAGQLAGETQQNRLRIEAEAAARLQHPNIIEVYEIGQTGQTLYLVLEYVEGGDLQARVGTDPQSPMQAAGTVETLARAVEHAHQQGIVHRDLKPQNVLVTPDGTLKITDFGLARRMESNFDLTQTGQIMGSPSYMAPEQARGVPSEIGPGTDLYALGSILYRLLTGHPPFQGPNHHALLDQLLHQDPVPPGRLAPGTPRDLEAICLRCLEKEPGKRYPSALELAEELMRYREGLPVRTRPIGPGGRLIKWARRNRAVATLLAGILLTLLALVGVGFSSAARLREAAQREHRQAEAAREQRAEAERNLGLALLSKADSALSENDILSARRLVASATKLPVGPAARVAALALPTPLFRLAREFVTNPTRAIDLSPATGRMIIARGPSIEVRDLSSGAVLRTLGPFASDITALSFSPGGDRVAAGLQNGNLILHTTDTNDPAPPTGDSTGHPKRIVDLAFSPDGSRIATASSDGTVKIWDKTGGKQLRALTGFPRPPTALRFSPDGEHLAVVDEDRQVRLWRWRSGGQPRVLLGHAYWVLAVDFSPKGNLLATAGADQTVIVWEVETGQRRFTLSGHVGDVSSVAFHPSGRFLLTAGEDGTIRVWELHRGTLVRTLAGPEGTPIELTISGDGRDLFIATDRGRITVWRMELEKRTRTLIPRYSEMTAVAISPDGTQVATGNYFGPVDRIDLASGRVVATHGGATTTIRHLAFTRDGSALVGGTKDGQVRLWRDNAQKPAWEFDTGTGTLHSLAIDPRNGQIAVSGAIGILVLLDPNSGRELRRLTPQRRLIPLGFDPEGNRPRAFATSPEGSHLMAVADAKTGLRIERLDSTGWTELHRLIGHTKSVHTLALSPDGQLLASAGSERTIYLWDVRSGTLLRKLWGHDRGIRALAFDRQGRFLVSTSADQSLRVWGLDAPGNEPLSPWPLQAREPAWRGEMYARERNPVPAVAELEWALFLDPDLAHAWRWLGIARGLRGNRIGAIEALERASELLRGNEMAREEVQQIINRLNGNR